MSTELADPQIPAEVQSMPATATAVVARRSCPRHPAPAVAELVEALLSLIGSQEGRARLARRAKKLARDSSSPIDPMVVTVCNAYIAHAENYYRKADGSCTSEVGVIRRALLFLKKRFARQRVSTFGPKRLKEVRDDMIAMGWCRKSVNQQVGRIKRAFKWAVSNELIPANVYHALQAVEGLRAGRSGAPESTPVKPVPVPMIEAILPLVSAQVQAMIRLQLVTGMRPGEVISMRTCDIDTTMQPWVYRPEHHKTEHHSHERYIFLGPKAQEVIQPFLNTEKPERCLFRPIDAERVRRKERHAQRKTPLSCGNRPGSVRTRNPKRPPGQKYVRTSYARAISRACEIAFPVPAGLNAATEKQWRREHHWHPHQLRHNAATRLRKEYGLDVAQVVLGHKTLTVTQVYAEKDVETAQQAMLKAG